MDLSGWEKQLGDVLPYVIDIRRELHAHPEISGEEHQTKERILRELSAYEGMEITSFEGCCSLMAVLRNGEGPCVAIRADMDALPMEEKTGLPFASCNSGVMHACGHDTHMALALGSARWFSRNRECWRGTVKWLFESQEETVGGGKQMVEQGCMNDPMVDYVIGQHVLPSQPAGVFFCKAGYVSGSSDDVHITVRGVNCHGAYPEKGVDAIVIAAQVITALQTLVSRNISPLDSAVLTIGAIHGGRVGNVVCNEVKLTGTLRTLKSETRKLLYERIEKTVCGIAEGMGGMAEVQIEPSYGSVYNDDAAYAKIEEEAIRILGRERIVLREKPSLGVESFCFFLKDTPGVYWDIGSGLSTELHTPTMMIDEAFFLPALALQCAAALRLLEK